MTVQDIFFVILLMVSIANLATFFHYRDKIIDFGNMIERVYNDSINPIFLPAYRPSKHTWYLASIAIFPTSLGLLTLPTELTWQSFLVLTSMVALSIANHMFSAYLHPWEVDTALKEIERLKEATEKGELFVGYLVGGGVQGSFNRANIQACRSTDRTDVQEFIIAEELGTSKDWMNIKGLPRWAKIAILFVRGNGSCGPNFKRVLAATPVRE